MRSPEAVVDIAPASDVRVLDGKAICERGQAIAAVCTESASLPTLRDVIRRRFVGAGYIDFYGYHAPSSGWFVCGWVSTDWVAHAKQPGDVTLHFETGVAIGHAVLNFYDREDLREKGLGLVLHVSTMERDLGRLVLISLRAGPAVAIVRPADAMDMLPPETTASAFHALIAGSDHGSARDHLRTLAARIAYDGRDTIGSLTDRTFLEFDEVIACPPDSVAIVGWMLVRPGLIAAMRVRCAGRLSAIDMSTAFFWTERPDVIESVGRDHGYEDTRCGFVARIPTPAPSGEQLYIEIQTTSGETACKPIPRGRLEGVPAIKRLLGCFETQYADVDFIYDHVLGPAVSVLNARRLKARPRVSPVQLGSPVARPRYSVIIPLYGRIDFMEMQMAVFATIGLSRDVEIIYVLDDPPKTRATQSLAASLHARFRLPFKVLCLSHNMGFAPANNIGLAVATGEFVCFLNSDVLPTSADWLERLAAHLDADSSLGVVGPLLLFEDRSVQHQGMFFKGLPQFGNWFFPHHTRKGFHRPRHTGLVRLNAITGAAMLLRRKDALDLGGFDEAYVIGDFEDTDLCLNLRSSGQGAAVDFGVAMYHLERKSQASSADTWRTNLTLYNCWVHQRRWAETIVGLPPQ